MNKALILSSTGSPLKADVKEIKLFLKNFLSDKNVIKIPKVILYLILMIRPKILKKKYEKVLIKNKTPLNYYIEELKEKLQKAIPEIKIEIGNLYSAPFLKEKIKTLKSLYYKKIYLLPLYPQGSFATSETLKNHFKEAMEEEKLDHLIFPEYFKHPFYIKAIAKSIEGKKVNFDFLIFSYHSLPQKMQGAMDYKEKCLLTTELILKELNFNGESITSFQSKFGFQKWLKPSTIEILKNISKKSYKKVGILSPSFSLDCLETLYDIKIYLNGIYKKYTKRDLIYINALNSSKEHIDFLKNFVLDNI